MNDMHPAILEWCCAREVCRRLGFTPDEIFFGLYDKGGVVNGELVSDPVITVELKRGGKSFIWTIGVVEMMTADEARIAYENACATWNAGGVSNETFFASQAFRDAIPLMHALRGKGFVLTSPN